MEHKGTVPLETPRLILRRFREEDIHSFYRCCLSDWQVWRWTNYPQMMSLRDVREKGGLFTPNWFAAYDKPNRYSWAIAQRPDGPSERPAPPFWNCVLTHLPTYGIIKGQCEV